MNMATTKWNSWLKAIRLNDFQISPLGLESHSEDALLSSLLDETSLRLDPTWAAHMSSDLAPYSLQGLQLAALHGGNLLSPELYPTLNQIEQETLKWLCNRFYKRSGHFTHGSSYGNLEALWRAREAISDRHHVVYCSRATHYSVDKACQLLGLELKHIETDDQDRINLSQLEAACQHTPPLAIVLNMGTTSLGSIDQLDKGIAIAKTYDAWCHVDAAWGGALMLIAEYHDAYSCLVQADSICFDPHKSLFQPKPSSVLLYNCPSPLTSSIDYLEATPRLTTASSYGGELFLPLWLNLKLLGSDWFLRHTQTRLEQAQNFSILLKQIPEITMVSSHSGICCFTCPYDLSMLVSRGVISQVKRQETFLYRVVFSKLNTTAEDIIKAIRLCL